MTCFPFVAGKCLRKRDTACIQFRDAESHAMLCNCVTMPSKRYEPPQTQSRFANVKPLSEPVQRFSFRRAPKCMGHSIRGQVSTSSRFLPTNF